MFAALDRERLHLLELWGNCKLSRHYFFNPVLKYEGIDIFTAVDAWLINSRNQDSNIPHHLAGSCTWAHSAHFRINNLSRRNFHFQLECSIVGFSYFHDPQKIQGQKHWELEECPAPALGMTSRRTKRRCHQSNDARGHRVIGWPHSRAQSRHGEHSFTWGEDHTMYIQ